MWQWFKNLFRQETDSLPPPQEEQEEGHYPQPTGLKNSLLEAINEVNQEAVKHEAELLKNDKLNKALKLAIKKMAKELHDTYDFVLVHDTDVGVHSSAFPTFYKIAQGVFKECGLPITYGGNHYIKVMKVDVRKAFQELKKPQINVDERVSAMLRQGPYR